MDTDSRHVANDRVMADENTTKNRLTCLNKYGIKNTELV